MSDQSLKKVSDDRITKKSTVTGTPASHVWKHKPLRCRKAQQRKRQVEEIVEWAIAHTATEQGKTDLKEFRELYGKTEKGNSIFACLLVLQDNACSVEHPGEDYQEET